eukprot:TRINITY_DN28263_c0_g8_i1.p1 TRINITY_DN28263_c0_g8~~TRINITY_DN28263_c0_g8_i1.p1  ORF type:complete len:257 (+),score=46.39 TRINITY_DN28263_c0_g8_i1:253-1023(+)
MTRQRGASDASGGSGAARPARLQRGSAAQQILFPFACCAACDHVDKGEESFQLRAKLPCDSYWLPSLSLDAIEERLEAAKASPYCAVLIKTHDWSSDYPALLKSLEPSPRIMLTHRDLRGVCASYRRVKWDIAIPDRYVQDHMSWREHCTLDIAYEDLVRDGASQLKRLATHLDIDLCTAELEDVARELQELKRCHMGNAVSQLTKLWPNHMSPTTRRLQGVAGTANDKLNELPDPSYVEVLNVRFAQFQRLYGYI